MNIDLYTTYFLSQYTERQKELDECMAKNLANELIQNIFVFVENHEDKKFLTTQFNAKKLNCLLINQIPRFKDWLVFSTKHSNPNSISIFSNSDIYFDDSIANTSSYLTQPKSLVCLSRHEDIGGNVCETQNPQWTQDVWAIRNSDITNIDFLEKLEIKAGQTRCDNKLAYFFAVNGWNLYNPFRDIKCYHKHESNIRSYDIKDKNNIGALAFVHPCNNHHPSEIEISVMPLKCTHIIHCELNKFLISDL